MTAAPPLALCWWYEHLLCTEGVQPEVFEHLGSLLLPESDQGDQPVLPAPLSVRLYLRLMNPKLTSSDQLLTADSEDILAILGYITSMLGAFRDEFNAAVDVRRVPPSAALVDGLAALQLARRVAARVESQKRLPAEADVQAMLVEVLEAASFEQLASSGGLQGK
jgi:hypothetical protein